LSAAIHLITITMTKFVLISVILGLLAGLGCAAKSSDSSASANANANAAPEPLVSVSTAPVVERTAPRALEVVGSLQAQDEVTVSSQASGNLDTITVDVGSQLRRGQIVATLDRRELAIKVQEAEAAVKQAEARLSARAGERVDPEKQPDVRQARAALERARYDLNASKDLAEHGDISQQQRDVYQRTYDQAEARYHAALENVRNLEAVLDEKRAALSLARKQLTDTEITSPIDGVVKEKQASRGEYLQPGKPVVTILQINPLRLRLEVPESFAAGIRPGQAVTLKVDTFGDQQFTGTIKRINPSLDEKNRSLIAEAEVRNDKSLLKPGMFARAQVVSESRATSLMVPEKAIASLAGVNKVFVLENGNAVERLVKLGGKDGALVEVLDGVQSGDRVITTNVDKLHDGMKVSGD